ncbi:MAG: YqeG family HAD IIIA-type phosphatase [Candidatus Izimaplasma sp.]|nr:YqeG family HAD IIIA-type phosphatase [Candidatus Izimaplasma bacterium]
MIHLLLKTKKFIPNEFHNNFFDIDFKELYNNGLRLVLTDLDNTLISYDESKPTKKILDKFEELRQIGFEVIVISNNVPSRLNAFLDGTSYKGVGNARKPLLIGLRKALRLADKDYSHKETVIIGDQLMTDVYCANRFNSYSILVNPLKKKTEKWYTKMNRKTEVKMLKKIERKYNDRFQKLSLYKRP